MGLNTGRLGAGGRRPLLMSSEENKKIALSLLEALNARDLSLWSQHLAEDYIAEHPGVSIPLDNSTSMGYQQRFVTALPDIHLEVLRVLAEGDHVLIHWTASGTHAERCPANQKMNERTMRK
jgi:ketosteroid isomerase-like protein